MKYKIEITETLQRIIKIEATDERTALILAKQLYSEEKIVLNSSHYIDTEINVITS